MLLSAEDIGVRRGGRWLLRGCTLRLHAGEGLHVLGRNGSGKTTLLRVLAGLSRPAAGRVCWDGIPIARLAEDYAAMLAYLGHGDGLAGDLTAHEHLHFALSGRAGTQPARLDDALDRLGVRHAAHLPARLLSAGQRRRVALARVLLTPAPLWLLDEPLSALDGAGSALVGELLREHLAGGGLAVVSTHQALPGLADSLATLSLNRA